MVMWEQVRTWFEIDGALRDILVRNTVEADWDRLFEALNEWGYQATWSLNGESIPAPENASAAWSGPEALLLSIQVGPARVNLHFFSVDEIEMDIDPREIQTRAAFEQIQDFIRRVGERLLKPVLLADEGMHDPAFMAYDPATKAFTLLDQPALAAERHEPLGGRPMKRTLIITLAVLGVGVLMSWALLRGETWTFSFTQEQIAEQLAKRFPMHKTYLVLIGVHYENPRVRLTDGSIDVAVGVDARVDGSVNGKELKGSADLVTKVAYDANSGTFLLHDAQLVGLKVAGVREDVAERVKGVANLLAAEQVSGIPIYKLRPTDVKTALARLILKSVSVRDGVLHIEVGL